MQNKWIEGDWIYDEETYPNIYTLCAVYANGAGIRVFEISDRKDDLDEMIVFLRKVASHKHRMVGFNNLGFDYVVLHEIITNYKNGIRMNSDDIYRYAMKVIDSHKGEGFGMSVRDSEVLLKQVDLYKIHHFDNPARATSLKMLEFNMRSDNIEDLPFPVGTTLTDEQKDVLIAYNKHDVMQTLKFYLISVPAIRFREDLSQKFGFDCTNFNDTKIGKEYFISRLEKLIPGSCYKKQKFGRKVNQTKRDSIALGEVIFPYVKFNRPEFKAVLEWFQNKIITETKGVLTDILECDLGEVAKYAQLRTKRQKFQGAPSSIEVSQLKAKNPSMWVDTVDLKAPKGAKSYWRCWNVADALNVVVDGFMFVFGTGGIHGSIESTTVRSDDEFVIIDADVSSMYPNIAISNNVYPEHLSKQFCKIYKDVYDARKSYAKGSPENAVMKLALNGVYGDSNNQFSPFFDSKYTMAITINGQLSLCMLAERLITIEGCSLIQVNTDGVTVKIPRASTERYYLICEQWQKEVGLQLEYAIYSAMFIRDVNNYIALYENGKLKNKGAYEYGKDDEGTPDYSKLGWHKNHSAMVIPMAAEYELLGKGSAEEFILSHKDKWDFMLRTKVDRSSRLVLVMADGSEVKQQNICRYYPVKEGGGKLVKIMPPLKGKEEAGERRLSIDAEWNVVPCNDISKFNWDINYDYYISEARKLIDPLKD